MESLTIKIIISLCFNDDFNRVDFMLGGFISERYLSKFTDYLKYSFHHSIFSRQENGI